MAHLQETRYRQRYLDLMVNNEVRSIFTIRAQVIQFVRRYLDDRGFLEVGRIEDWDTFRAVGVLSICDDACLIPCLFATSW